MRLRTPDFWYSDPNDSVAFVLRPLGWLYGLVGRIRHAMATPYRSPVPVICIGNLTAGGTGKTPVAMAVAALLARRGLKVAFLSRGYGADVPGAMIVDPAQDIARDVGDEPLMLAQHAMAVVSPDRPAGARLAVSRGAQVIVMDDGFQNPGLAKDLSLLIVDAQRGFGNGCLIPAGPLRERVADGVRRADAIIAMGDGPAAIPQGKPVLHAAVLPQPGEAERLEGKPVVAFAGIGDPARFFATAAACGAEVRATKAFPDHHAYSDTDIAALVALARRHDARLLTTEKDWLRLAPAARAQADVLKVAARFDEASLRQLEQFIEQCLKKPRFPAPAAP